jgi:hypothetical protein
MSTIRVDWDNRLVYVYLTDDLDPDRHVVPARLTLDAVADYDAITGQIVGVEILNLPFDIPGETPRG